VTREHKLALIVGFSLILLVGVLISDHLSRARQAKVSPVGQSETLLADSSLPPPNDPLRVLSNVVNPTAAVPANMPLSNEPTATLPVASGSPTGQPSAAPGGNGEVIMIVQGREQQPVGGVDPRLTDVVEQNGGRIITGSNGQPEIVMPPAAGAMTVSRQSPGTSDRPKVHATPEPANLAGLKSSPARVETAKLHQVQRGETLFQIAGKYYGSGHVWRELAKYNGVSSKEGTVRVGDQLKIPSRDVLLGRPAPTEAKAPAAQPAPSKKSEPDVTKPPRMELATYTVKKGDTLGEISLKVLGTSRRWQEIAKLNKISDVDSIDAGTVLKVPAMRG